jgi:hypothetical protein
MNEQVLFYSFNKSVFVQKTLKNISKYILSPIKTHFHFIASCLDDMKWFFARAPVQRADDKFSVK